MAKIVEMPKLSPTMDEGLLAVWHKKEGDSIDVDDLLAEVETDKATMEFRAFDRGTLLKLLVPAGATVKLGQAVAIVGAAGENIDALLASIGQTNVQAATAAASAPVTVQQSAISAPSPVPVAEAASSQKPPAAAQPPPRGNASALDRTSHEPDTKPADSGRKIASPYVRKLARDRGVDLASTPGTGDNGRILPDDVARAATALVRSSEVSPTVARAQGAEGPTTSLSAPTIRPLSPMRKTIAKRLVASKQTVPHFYLNVDIDAAALAALREDVNAQLAAAQATSKPNAEPAEKPAKVSINDFVVKAVALALARVPECNAQFAGDEIWIHSRIDISVAVAIPDGLVTPVVRDANTKSVLAIAREIRDLASRARQKKLRPEEMSDGTFSISNLGMFGIDSFSAVINPPEGAILAVGRVRDVPVVADGQLVAGKRLAVTLSCDHRVIDGAIGAAFLAELKLLLEQPMLILAG